MIGEKYPGSHLVKPEVLYYVQGGHKPTKVSIEHWFSTHAVWFVDDIGCIVYVWILKEGTSKQHRYKKRNTLIDLLRAAGEWEGD